MDAESILRNRGEWYLTYDGYDPAVEPLREALCTVGNGLFATRGAAPECDADDVHYPGTYIAGVFNRLRTEKAGRTIEDESMVNAPNWLPLTFRIEDGPWFHIDDVEVISSEQVLELRTGLLVRTVRFKDARGYETSLTQRRLAHMRTPNLAALETTVRPENWSGSLFFRAALDGGVVNGGVRRYRDLPGRHLEVLETAHTHDGITILRARTVQSRLEIAEAMRVAVFVNNEPVEFVGSAFDENGGRRTGCEFTVRVDEGDVVRAEKTVAIYTSRDLAISEPGLAALETVRRAGSFDTLAEEHAAAWEELWECAAIGIEGHPRADMVLNVHTFHVLQTISPNSIGRDIGIPARGLHGEAYRGHIFWDELFIFPYLNHRFPDLARSLLLYRYRRLEAARARARDAGLAGAMYPWQSGSDGCEETQVVHLNPASGRWISDNSRLQYHVGVAIAYDVWKYVMITGDIEFLATYGMEMFLDICLFWESIATYDTLDNVFDIVGVMGPDEFHDSDPGWDGQGIRNNTYTNVMVAWMFTRVPELLGRLSERRRQRLMTRTGVDAARLARWAEMSGKLRIPLLENGIPAQFQGYEDLEELDWDRYRERYGDIQRLDRILEAEGDTVARYKASKQADVLMLFYLLSFEELQVLLERLGVAFDHELYESTVRYYLDRTSHGSTLSRLVHSWVLARIDRTASLDLFIDVIESDIEDIQGGTTSEGIHLAAMAGAIDIVERCYSGMEVLEDRLRFDPTLPDGLGRVVFRVYYRHRWLTVKLSDGEVTIGSEVTRLRPVDIESNGEVHSLRSGGRVALSCADRMEPQTPEAVRSQ